MVPPFGDIGPAWREGIQVEFPLVRIDLHTHSTASDGTDSPADLVRAAKQAGLDVVALTDHDTTAGWAEAEQAARQEGIGLVRGSEISTRTRGGSVHLLSYLHDPDNTALAESLQRARTSRVRRARAMTDLLARDYPLTWEDVLAHTPEGATVGRPHLADALVTLGVARNRDEVFLAILADGGRYDVPYDVPTPIELVALVRDAGGVPVIAHPGAKRGLPVLSDAAIADLAAAGLVGLEVDHRDHSEAERTRLRALAADLGLLVTGSSDYHGTGKLNQLGEHTTAPQVLEEILARGSMPLVR